MAPVGMWSDGTTIWVADGADIKLYAYNLGTKARDASKDFDTLDAASNNNPRGIWSDGTTMWVADYRDGKVYAYDLTTKARDASKDFDTLLTYTTGIWSNGTTMWVAVQLPGKIYAYDMTTKARDAGKDFDTLDRRRQQHPVGIWSNNITMWATDEDDGRKTLRLQHGQQGTRRRQGLQYAQRRRQRSISDGIWATTTTMWASDAVDGKIYSYNMPVIAPNTPAAGMPAVTAPNVFRVPAVLGVDLSGITDTEGTTGIASNATYSYTDNGGNSEGPWQRYAANGTMAGHGQHRDGCNLHPDRRGRGEDAEGGGQLMIDTDNGGNSEGPLIPQRRDRGDHRGGELCRSHPDRRGGVPRTGQEGGGWGV